MITNIENWLEGTYPIKITDLKKISSGLLISARSDSFTQNYLLQATELSTERLLFIHTGILHLNKNGFPNVEAYVETRDYLSPERKTKILPCVYIILKVASLSTIALN